MPIGLLPSNIRGQVSSGNVLGILPSNRIGEVAATSAKVLDILPSGLIGEVVSAASGLTVLDSGTDTNTGYGKASVAFNNVKAGDRIVAMGWNGNGSPTAALTLSDDAGNTYTQVGVIQDKGYEYGVATVAADAATLNVQLARSGGGQKILVAARVSGPPLSIDTPNVQAVKVFYPSNQPTTDFTFNSSSEAIVFLNFITGMSGSTPGNATSIITVPPNTNVYSSETSYSDNDVLYSIGSFSNEPVSFNSSVTGSSNNSNVYLVFPFTT